MLARPRSVLRCVPLPFLARGVRTSTAAALCAVGVVNLKKERIGVPFADSNRGAWARPTTA